MCKFNRSSPQCVSFQTNEIPNVTANGNEFVIIQMKKMRDLIGNIAFAEDSLAFHWCVFFFAVALKTKLSICDR